jgi:hypothetical protein
LDTMFGGRSDAPAILDGAVSSTVCRQSGDRLTLS